jgi:hypothetical protein
MSLKDSVRGLFRSAGFAVHRLPAGRTVYDDGGLLTFHNHEFLQDPQFQKAYARGIKAAGDLNWHFRVHVGLWAAYSASKLDGDFVECGVNRGFLSSAIMTYLDWDKLGKTFYLLDTFAGLDEGHVTKDEAGAGKIEQSQQRLDSGFYVKGVEGVRANFSEWKNARIIQGTVPETLAQIESKRIAYLHLDMNCSPPEVAAFNALWDRLAPGAFILLDDYAFFGYESQKGPMDVAAAAKGIKILSVPTGQGLLIKPAK